MEYMHVCVSNVQYTASASKRASLRWTRGRQSGRLCLQGFCSWSASVDWLFSGRGSLVSIVTNKVTMTWDLMYRCCLCFSLIIIWSLIKHITWHIMVYLQCMEMSHIHLRRSTRKKSCRGCWTWESTQWRVSQSTGTTKTSSGKSKGPRGPWHILENKSRPTQQYNITYISVFISCPNYLSLCILEDIFLLWSLCIIEIKIKTDKTFPPICVNFVSPTSVMLSYCIPVSCQMQERMKRLQI